MGFTEEFIFKFKLLVAAAAQNNGTLAAADPALRKAFLQDLLSFLTNEFVGLSLLCLVLVFSVAASVHSTFEDYSEKVSCLKEMVLCVRGRWKRVLKTSIWVFITSTGSSALLFFVLGVAGFMAGEFSMKDISWIVFIFGGGYTVFLYSLWMLGIVVPVIEENLSELKATSEANELMKGKKLKGLVLRMLMIWAGGALSMAFAFLTTATATVFQNSNLILVVALGIGVSWRLVFCVIKVFVFVVSSIFYHEGKQIKIVEENWALYSPLGAAAEV